MKLAGIVLIVIGIVGLIFGGMSWTRDETVLDAGPLEIETEQRESIPIGPIASGVALAAGLVLVVSSGRRAVV